MSLMKKIIVGMGVVILASTPMVGASEVPETKNGQTKQALMERFHEISRPMKEKIDIYVPRYTESAHIFTALNSIPLLIGCMKTSRVGRYFGAFATIVPLCNTYSFYKFDEKMEALCPPKTEYGDFRAPYDRKIKSHHLLFGGSIVGSTLATAATKHPAFLYYALLASMWQGVDLAVSGLSLKHAELNSAILENHTAREENDEERRKFMEHLHRVNNS